MKKILVWHQGALGDLILSLPAVYAIKKHGGGVSLHLVCRADMSGFILEKGLADGVTSNEKGTFGSLFGDLDRYSRDLKSFLDGFDGAFVFMRSRDDVFLDNLRRHIPHCHYIRAFPPPGMRMHVPRYQLEQLAGLGVDQGGGFPILGAGSDPSLPAGPTVIAVHPGSGGKKKCWPLHNYLRLMEELNREGDFSLVVILGPAEDRGEYETVNKFISEKGISAEIIENMPVSEVISVLKKAALYIGNDSGITHLASALGVPAVAIFGPTDHEIWKPLGGNVRIVRSAYPCAPCEEEAYRRCGKAECLETLRVETVLEECRRAGRVKVS
jgi:ADP-heptose:LPS heptosyltransferase